MDRATEDLNKASHALLDAEIRLRTVVAQRTQLEKQIAILTAVEANLEENIRVLKQKDAIIIASEYKKAISDLATARVRRSFLRVDRENCMKIEGHAEFVHEKAKAEYDRLFNMIHNPPNNVIPGNFGKK
jgi:hypothetical protein